jgi:hypothetical protein
MTSDDADTFEYPLSWAPPGVQPPLRRDYTPPLRSALGVPMSGLPARHKYPPEWRPQASRGSSS